MVLRGRVLYVFFHALANIITHSFNQYLLNSEEVSGSELAAYGEQHLLSEPRSSEGVHSLMQCYVLECEAQGLGEMLRYSVWTGY